MWKYQVVEGRVYNAGGCEINLSSHCNLSCRSCQHLSPVLPAGYLQVDEIVRDLKLLGKYYRPRFLKILGGEPLLHPKLYEVLRAIRGTGISERLRICTNGKFLYRVTSEFWDLINDLEISIYPGSEPDLDFLQPMLPELKERGIRVRAYRYNAFREAYSESGTRDEALPEKIYNSCQIVHTWKSHTVANGYFYKCPPSFFLPGFLTEKFDDKNEDGIKIENSEVFRSTLLEYLNRENCLKSCSFCIGTVGKKHVHEQVARKTWRENQFRPTEDMIDYDLMKSCTNAIASGKGHLDDDCAIQVI